MKSLVCPSPVPDLGYAHLGVRYRQVACCILLVSDIGPVLASDDFDVVDDSSRA